MIRSGEPQREQPKNEEEEYLFLVIGLDVYGFYLK